MALQVGDKAPDFKLISSEKQEVSLSQFAGSPVVMAFFPFAFTGTCTNEVCSLRDTIAEYSDLNATVLGISVDSPFTLDRFKQEHELNFSLLSDFNKTTSQDYGTFYEEFVMGLKGVSKRSAFLVAPDGTIAYAEVLEKASELPDFEALKAKLQSL